MSTDLARLGDYAARMADTDPDTLARPIWSQIAQEVDGYLGRSADPEAPCLFGEV